MLHGVGGRGYPEAVFRRQMEYLREEFEVVPLERILQVAGERSHEAAGQVALTFDDGLRNSFTLAYPILLRLGLPATFYVCPELIETGHWLWNHEARERLSPDPRVT